MAIPNALTQACVDLTTHEALIRALCEDRGNDLLNRSPAGGGWSALQCIEHLILANCMLATAVQEALPASPVGEVEPSELSPGIVWRFMLWAVEPEVRMKGFAPKRLMPASGLDRVKVLADYLASHAELRALAIRCAGLDLNRKRLRHPAIHLKMSIGSVFQLVAVHERRHIAQAERAVRPIVTPRFPNPAPDQRQS